MKLSIIVTTRNRKEDLLNCIESIKKANISNYDWELIVVDDNSNDGTEKITFDEFGVSNGKIIRNLAQQMMVKSRNTGAKEARGEYALFIDDDNIVDKNMVEVLLKFAKHNSNYGIIGPSMYFLKNKKKYLDFQKINFFTGGTTGKIDNSEKEVCDSDGIPNAFLIKKEVFNKCGFFNEQLIQTFTEPDFAFNALKCGYKCGIIKKAKIYHNISPDNSLTPRTLGGQFSQKAYCLMRNRTIIVCRYGKWHQEIIYLLFFSWFWPLTYSIMVLKEKRFDLIKLYWRGFFDGIGYFFTGKISKFTKKVTEGL
ncbi:MAG TPA: hypothetical protein DCS28_01330 [Candidatus Moranbacteria bacterium]|nr:hypothetical protein [Candidatus Moranbacteria bacterium]HAT74668.1 hypothetical protein [Candidatus Moranbacteria bacterium]